MDALGIDVTEVSADRVVATMQVSDKTRQPAGILHGGASVALAESVASIGAAYSTDLSTHMPVGLEINANHIRSKQDGVVTAVATPLHKGRTTMVWEVLIRDEEERLICVSRCTIAIVARKTAVPAGN